MSAIAASDTAVRAAPGFFQRNSTTIVLSYALLVILAMVILFPVFWMFSSSFKGPTEMFALDMTLLPRVWTWENYANVWFKTPFPRYFVNSLYIASMTTALTVLLSVYAAYALARIRFRGRFLFGTVLLVTQMFPHIMLVLPLFMIVRSLGLFNTHAALIVAYVTFSLPFSIWLLRGFFAAIPEELEDAAAIDGASVLGTLHRIILPLAGPGIAAVAMFTFIRAWNEFLFALVLLQSGALRTLPLGLASFQEEYTNPLGPAHGRCLHRVAAAAVLLSPDAAPHRPGPVRRSGQGMTPHRS